MSRTRIKICGITERTALDAAVAGGADFMGFVRWRGSPRFIEAGEAEQLARMLPESVEPVGLFVDAPLQEMTACPFRWIQLHGSEDESISDGVKAAGKQVIRGFRFDPTEVTRWDACRSVDRLLVDGSTVGGEGIGFEHDALAEVLPNVRTPLLLAGGLDPSNVTEAIGRTMPWGVDVSSGVERTRGEKDPALIEAFCSAVRSAT